MLRTWGNWHFLLDIFFTLLLLILPSKTGHRGGEACKMMWHNVPGPEAHPWLQLKQGEVITWIKTELDFDSLFAFCLLTTSLPVFGLRSGSGEKQSFFLQGVRGFCSCLDPCCSPYCFFSAPVKQLRPWRLTCWGQVQRTWKIRPHNYNFRI